MMGGFGQVMKSMLNWQPSGSPAWARQQQAKNEQAEQQIRQAQEQRAAQQADLDFHQHMIEIGALPVVNGLVKDKVQLDAPAMQPPDQSQAGASAAPSSFSNSQPSSAPSPAGAIPLNAQSLSAAMLPPAQS